MSPQGSQFCTTGVNIFHHKYQAITIGDRYQHLSNANISVHNPGTDANSFDVGCVAVQGERGPADGARFALREFEMDNLRFGIGAPLELQHAYRDRVVESAWAAGAGVEI